MKNGMRPRDQLQRQYRLNVLQLRMDSADGKGMVIFTLTAGDGEEIARLTAPIGDVGLPAVQSLDLQGETGLEDNRFRLPERILITLQSLISETGNPSDPLWLRISVPRGFLAAVPWERLLQPALGIPVLRLPQYLICPHAPPAHLDFVLCMSSTTLGEQAQAALVREVIRHVPPALAGKMYFHVFTESKVHPLLHGLAAPEVPAGRISVHAPPASLDDAASPIARPCENWWLSWMKSVLGATTADEILFLCDGYRVRDEGALVLREPGSIGDADCTERLVFATELVEFLEDVGAWSFTIASTPCNRSASGLRMLHDRVAQQRPGPTVLYDMEYRHDLEALRQSWEFLYMPPRRPPQWPTLSICCHPLWASGESVDMESMRQLQQYTLDGKLGERLTAESPPAWLASVQRKLEATAGELADAESADPETGRKRAREFVVNTIAEHWQRLSGNAEGDKK